ncbi:hypothetical protein WJX82_007285 [Trebouxia sp. C0006]
MQQQTSSKPTCTSLTAQWGRPRGPMSLQMPDPISASTLYNSLPGQYRWPASHTPGYNNLTTGLLAITGGTGLYTGATGYYQETNFNPSLSAGTGPDG